MSPKGKHNYLGIEIECISELPRETVKKLIKDKGLKDLMDCGTDSSIKCSCPRHTERSIVRSGTYEYLDIIKTKTCLCEGFEFRILTKEKDLKSNLIKVGEILRGINAYVNGTCGLHIHLDMRNRSPLMSAERLFNVQPLIMNTIDKSRKRNDYCRRVKNVMSLLDHDKYKAINFGAAYSKHKTIEVRAHEGTVDTNEICNWAEFLVESLNQDIPKPIKSTKTFSKGTKKYLDARIRMNKSKAKNKEERID